MLKHMVSDNVMKKNIRILFELFFTPFLLILAPLFSNKFMIISETIIILWFVLLFIVLVFFKISSKIIFIYILLLLLLTPFFSVIGEIFTDKIIIYFLII